MHVAVSLLRSELAYFDWLMDLNKIGDAGLDTKQVVTEPNFCFLAGVAPLAGVDDDFLLFGLEYISRTLMVFVTSFRRQYHGVSRKLV